MNDEMKEFFDELENEEIELLVRISYCDNTLSSKGNGINLGTARFDKALLMNNTEFEDCQKYNQVLNWLVKDDEINTSKDYKFKVGKVYRVKVKPAKIKEGAKYRDYYLLYAIEYDATGTLLDEKFNFENNYLDEVEELKVLIQHKLFGYSPLYDYRFLNTDFIGAIDKNNNFINHKGVLSWYEKNTDISHKFNLEDLEIYRIKVKKNKSLDNYYWLMEVLEKDSDDRLLKLKEEYLKPVKKNIDNITFTLNKDLMYYKGIFNYKDRIIMYIFLRNDKEISEKQLKLLHKITSNMDKYNHLVKGYIIDSLTELANNVWLDDKITKEQFYNILSEPISISIYDDEIEFEFDDHDIFLGHTISVIIDENDNCYNVDIVG